MRTCWFKIEGVEELKRNVRIYGVKKEALHTTLGRDIGSMIYSIDNPTLRAGNPVKEILLILDLSNHRYNMFDMCTDISKNHEKTIKNGQTRTRERKSVQKPEAFYEKVKKSKQWSTSENVHANPSSIIESLPVSLIPIEDNNPVHEEIDIFLIPDDLIPLGVENDDSEDEDNELPNLDHQDTPSSPRPPPEPPDVCLNFKPDTAMNDEHFNQGEIVLFLNVEDFNSFTFVIWTFLSFFTYPKDSPIILPLSGVGTSFLTPASLLFIFL
ncbi:hypothetical protein Tco_1448953 [Tanacetum coccineum]